MEERRVRMGQEGGEIRRTTIRAKKKKNCKENEIKKRGRKDRGDVR